MEQCFQWPVFSVATFLPKEAKTETCLLELILKAHISSFTQDKVRRMCCCCVFRLLLLWLTVPGPSADGISRNNCRQIDSGALIPEPTKTGTTAPRTGPQTITHTFPSHSYQFGVRRESTLCPFEDDEPLEYSIGHFPWSHSLSAQRGRKDLKGSIQSRGKRFRSVVSHLQESSHRPSETSAALLQTGICFPFCLFFPSRPSILPRNKLFPLDGRGCDAMRPL